MAFKDLGALQRQWHPVPTISSLLAGGGGRVSRKAWEPDRCGSATQPV